MIIRKYFRGYDVEDLHQVGVIGVIKAYKNYKEEKSAKFSTYAYKYIYGEIYSYINSTKILKVAKENYSLFKKINEAKTILSQKLMKEPSLWELSSFLEIDPEIITSVYASMEIPDSLDRVIYSDGKDVSLFDTVEDKRDYYNIDYLLLNEEIDKLSEEERELIYLRYFEDRTQKETADILGLNQVQVSRSEKKILVKIKKEYENAA